MALWFHAARFPKLRLGALLAGDHPGLRSGHGAGGVRRCRRGARKGETLGGWFGLGWGCGWFGVGLGLGLGLGVGEPNSANAHGVSERGPHGNSSVDPGLIHLFYWGGVSLQKWSEARPRSNWVCWLAWWCAVRKGMWVTHPSLEMTAFGVPCTSRCYGHSPSPFADAWTFKFKLEGNSYFSLFPPDSIHHKSSARERLQVC